MGEGGIWGLIEEEEEEGVQGGDNVSLSGPAVGQEQRAGGLQGPASRDWNGYGTRPSR